jgi:hypothetical protein
MLNPLALRAARRRLAPRRVRPGLHRPGQAEAAQGGLLSVLALSAAVGAAVGLAAAGGLGAFSALHPVARPASAASHQRVALNADQLFPPLTPKTVDRRVDVYDPAPPAPLIAAAAAAPRPAPAATAQPAPSPSPYDDGGGGDDR